MDSRVGVGRAARWEVGRVGLDATREVKGHDSIGTERSDKSTGMVWVDLAGEVDTPMEFSRSGVVGDE